MFRLDGQVAIVTGGAGKLGSAMCDALAEAGAHVVVAARNLERCEAKAKTLSASGVSAMAVACDATVPADVSAMTAKVLDRFGRIDILVNNAYSGRAGKFEEMSLDDFEAAFRGAVSSTFLCSQAVLPAMRNQRRGAIINIASIYGIVSPDQRIYGNSGLNNPCNYGPAKAAVIQFTRWLATYAAPDGIRVNAITPGGFYDAKLSERADYEDVFVPNYAAKTPLGRMGKPQDLKGAVLFLSSDASEWVTGANLVVDGGWTAW
ncbi:MAG: SDR family oxidoreductase [Bryobacterales bacterium]|nr:SDR family oxidoreductase [Bryobacterales bacterium]